MSTQSARKRRPAASSARRSPTRQNTPGKPPAVRQDAAIDWGPVWGPLVARQPPRRIPGLWGTAELARLLGVGSQAVIQQVYRGRLTPIDRIRGQQHLFEDREVLRYLTSPQTRGRPPRAAS